MTLPEILKRLESREFDESGAREMFPPDGVKLCRWQFAQDQALIRTLIEVVRLQDDMFGKIHHESQIAKASGCVITETCVAEFVSEARERALTLLREMK